MQLRDGTAGLFIGGLFHLDDYYSHSVIVYRTYLYIALPQLYIPPTDPKSSREEILGASLTPALSLAMHDNLFEIWRN